MDELNVIIEQNNKNKNNPSDGFDELDIYLNKDFNKKDLDLFNDNPLLFWTSDEARVSMDRLSRESIFIFTIQASEAPSECLFSLSNNIVTEKRTQLKNRKISLLTFLVSRWVLYEKKKK